jgi:hypothetical protein
MTMPKRSYCDKCGKRELERRLISVQTARQTHWSPAEYESWCDTCHDAAVQAGERDDEMRSLRGYDPQEIAERF